VEKETANIKTGYFDSNGKEISKGDTLYLLDTYTKTPLAIGVLTNNWRITWDSPEYNQNFWVFVRYSKQADYLDIMEGDDSGKRT
jgi:hypothetical protein